MKKTIFYLSSVFVLFFGFSSCSSSDEDVVSYPKPTYWDNTEEGIRAKLKIPLYFPFYFDLDPDNPFSDEGVDLGRHLFYEKGLSADQSISCASCHQQKLAFTDGLAKSIGVGGAEVERSSMAVQNLLWGKNFLWDGKANSLREQSLMPIIHPKEMGNTLEGMVSWLEQSDFYKEKFGRAFENGKIDEANTARALAQFIKTIISKDSKYDKYITEQVTLTDSEERGRKLFYTHPIALANIRGANCGDCHAGNLQMGTPIDYFGYANNGLEDDMSLESGLAAITGNDLDKGKFKTVSLRNIALTAPYMHDGRFNTLEEVVDNYNDHIKKSSTLDILILEGTNLKTPPSDGSIKLGLTDEEKADLIAFLHTLTDESFTTNPAYSNPFE